MCRSQPSKVQGRHGSGFCTIQTLPRFWIVPLACQGASRPPTGHGPQTRGSMGPNSANVAPVSETSVWPRIRPGRLSGSVSSWGHSARLRSTGGVKADATLLPTAKGK